jgi:hypothetical protein
MSWQIAVFSLLALVLIAGGIWFERSRPSARILAAVAALAAVAVAGRIALAPLPNVVATTDVVLLAGYTLGGAPGFAVGALSAVVSNFWLGQGPWTPWQMAGWGMVGVGGAVLAAATARRLGRWGLAAAAAVAGLAYGALLDLSTMVSFGGEQSLERYLALSARGIPFNLAHAAGNAALMLAAGPAMVRMLDRYRTRFEFRWTAPRAGGSLACLLAACALAVPVLAPPRAPAVAVTTAGAGDGRAWLERAQNRDGGYGIAPGSSSNVGMTAWAMLGLEAAGRNPLDVRSGGRSPVAYLRRNLGGLRASTDLSLTVLALEGAGVSSRSFGGRDLVAELRTKRRGDGSFQGWSNPTAYGILALRSAGIRGSELGRSAAWLRRVQNDDGGWASVRGGPSEPDSTASALQALAAAPGGGGQIADGARWLRRAQRGDGGFALTGGSASNSQSTAWAIQGLVAAGTNPAGVRSGGRSPLDYLAARQASDGHYAYAAGNSQTPVWVTAQALTGATRTPFPIPRVPRVVRSRGGGGAGKGHAGGAGGTTADGPGRGERANGARPGPGRKAGRKARGDRRRAAAAAEAPVSEELVAGEAAAPSASGSIPATGVLLAALGILAGGMVAGFFVYRRRLP